MLFAAVVYSFVDLPHFLAIVSGINSWILDHFGWLFSASTLLLIGTLLAAYFSPLGNVRIGGEDAKPLLDKWRWFSITLCTTIASGILFWGTAEPLFHLYGPPITQAIEANSPAAINFALSTMFLHWSFSPYAIYCVPALMFSLAYYNLNRCFSIGSSMYPLIGKYSTGRGAEVIDAIALFALVSGMASSLGAGILVLAGGVESVLGIPNSHFSRAAIASVIVATYVLSALSGLQKGIARLSNINIKVFFGVGLFVFLFGPTVYILNVGFESFGEYLNNFFSRSMYLGAADGDGWAKSWTVFYWANWYAWAPISALFLGRIARGYTVREFIRVNMLYPSCFACVWLAIFSSTAIQVDGVADGILHATLLSNGPEAVLFKMFEYLPLASVTAIVFIGVTYISYVTAADSNTDAMGNLCAKDAHAKLENEEQSSSLLIKLVWGICIGIVAWVMVSFASIDGIKMITSLGGLPSLFMISLICFSLIKMIKTASSGTKIG